MADNGNAPNCPRCGSWSPGGARFCHQCGYFLLTSRGRGYSFESSLGGGDLHTPGASQFRSKTPISEHLMRVGVVAAGALVGVLFLEWDGAWVVVAPVSYVLLGPATEFIGMIAGKIPTHELSQDKTITIRTEHKETSDFGKRRVLLGELPAQITIDKLKHVARVCLPIADGGDGKKFSRPNVQKGGVFSQNDFKVLRDSWLESRHCFWLDVATPQQGVVLTHRCIRLLRKTIKITAIA